MAGETWRTPTFAVSNVRIRIGGLIWAFRYDQRWILTRNQYRLTSVHSQLVKSLWFGRLKVCWLLKGHTCSGIVQGRRDLQCWCPWRGGCRAWQSCGTDIFPPNPSWPQVGRWMVDRIEIAFLLQTYTVGASPARILWNREKTSYLSSSAVTYGIICEPSTQILFDEIRSLTASDIGSLVSQFVAPLVCIW
jgi:hypothetical protein